MGLNNAFSTRDLMAEVAEVFVEFIGGDESPVDQITACCDEAIDQKGPVRVTGL